MKTHSYWQTQSSSKPLFPNIAWSKPEQRSLAGKLGIVGGNKQGFIAVAESYSTALSNGVGEARVLVPDSLKKSIPPTITDVVFAKSNPSGSLAQEAKHDLSALADWSSGILMIGDSGQNSETAILYEEFLSRYEGQLTISRDAIDLLRQASGVLVRRPKTMMVLSFAQAQKLFQTVYYPKMLTFSMQLAQAVEALHKFTITYPITLVTFHKDHLIIAHDGNVTTTPWENPMSIWRGVVATQAAVYWLWNPNKPLEAATASLHTD